MGNYDPSFGYALEFKTPDECDALLAYKVFHRPKQPGERLGERGTFFVHLRQVARPKRGHQRDVSSRSGFWRRLLSLVSAAELDCTAMSNLGLSDGDFDARCQLIREDRCVCTTKVRIMAFFLNKGVADEASANGKRGMCCSGKDDHY